jgi:anti-sigma factor RsiW
MMMECDTCQEQMSLWIDDQLTPNEIREIEAHAAACPSCRASLDTLRRLDRLLTSAPMVSPLPGFSDRFQAKLVTRRRRRRTWAGLLTLMLATLALSLGAALLLMLSGLTLWGSLPVGELLPQATSLLLNLGKVAAASLKLTWLILGALARGLRHPVFIVYVAATAILIAVWTEIVLSRTLARHPVSTNLGG